MRKIIIIPISLFLSLLLTGCFTQLTARKAFNHTFDTFEAEVVYKSHLVDDIVIQGSCYKWNGSQMALAYSPVYLVIPSKVLVVAHNHSGGDVSINQIRNLPADVRLDLRLAKSLPSGFEKYAVIPKDGSGLQLNQLQVNQKNHVSVINLAKLPFAFVLDATTFPLEVLIAKSWQGLN